MSNAITTLVNFEAMLASTHTAALTPQTPGTTLALVASAYGVIKGNGVKTK